MIDWWWWINGWMDNGWETNRWWMKSKTDIRVTVFILVHSLSNAGPQVLILLGPSIVQVWDRTQTARRVWSWKETQLPWRRLYLFYDEAGGRGIRSDGCRIPCECVITCGWKTLTVLAYMDPSLTTSTQTLSGYLTFILQTWAALTPKCAAF